MLPVQTPVESAHSQRASSRAWYSALIAEFLQSRPDTIPGRLTRNSEFSLLPTQKDAWLDQIAFLTKKSLRTSWRGILGVQHPTNGPTH